MSKVFNPQNALKLETEERYKALPPFSVLSQFLPSTAKVCADVGCGTGFFTIPITSILVDGTVYALDISDHMLSFLKKRVDDELSLSNTTRIIPMSMQPDVIPLSDGLVDFTFCSFVLHEANDSQAFADELVRVTAPGGVVVVLEWDLIPSPFGPPADHRISSEFVVGLFNSKRVKSVQTEKIGEWFYAVKVEIG